MPKQDSVQLAPAEGKLGLGKPIGTLTQLGTVRLGKRTEGRSPAIRDLVPLAKMSDIEVACLDLAQRAGMRGIQEWLCFCFKEPMHAPEIYPEHAIFIQLMKLSNTLRWMCGEDLITHLGLEYYD